MALKACCPGGSTGSGLQRSTCSGIENLCKGWKLCVTKYPPPHPNQLLWPHMWKSLQFPHWPHQLFGTGQAASRHLCWGTAKKGETAATWEGPLAKLQPEGHVGYCRSQSRQCHVCVEDVPQHKIAMIYLFAAENLVHCSRNCHPLEVPIVPHVCLFTKLSSTKRKTTEIVFEPLHQCRFHVFDDLTKMWMVLKGHWQHKIK